MYVLDMYYRLHKKEYESVKNSPSKSFSNWRNKFD